MVHWDPVDGQVDSAEFIAILIYSEVWLTPRINQTLVVDIVLPGHIKHIHIEYALSVVWSGCAAAVT